MLPHQAAAAPVTQLVDSPTMLEDLLRGMDVIQDSRDRKGNYAHVSDLVHDFCPRRSVLMVRHDLESKRAIRSADRVLWALGRGIEAHVRNTLIRSLNYSGIVGNWSCPCGALRSLGFHDSRNCSRCGSIMTTYDEVDLEDGDALVTGHPDLLFTVRRGLQVLEIKSLKQRAAAGPGDFCFENFAKGQQASPDHVLQAASYRRMLLKAPTTPISPVVSIIYVSKDYQFVGSPYKEFHINVDSPVIDNSLDSIWAQAVARRDNLAAKTIPARLPACIAPSVPMAKKCEACASCFSVA